MRTGYPPRQSNEIKDLDLIQDQESSEQRTTERNLYNNMKLSVSLFIKALIENTFQRLHILRICFVVS